MQKHKRDWTNIKEVTVVTIISGIYDSIAIKEVYDSLLDALKVWHWKINLQPGDYNYNPFHQIKFYDEFNLEIPDWKIQEVILQNPQKRKYYRRPGRFVFRNGPVEGIHNRYWRGCWRHPKTISEIRENDFINYDDDCIEYDIKVRGNRKKSNLPTSWDDVYRHKEKNWKKQRDHQWK